MRYPRLLEPGDYIGVCAPSAGVQEEHIARLLRAKENVEALGYRVVEAPSVRGGAKCVSADAATRAREFQELYRDPAIRAIIPPWGGEFLMDMLPHLDFEELAHLPQKWVCGYSDLTTLTFALTTMLDIATVHGSNFMNMGYASIHMSDQMAFEVMSQESTMQESAPFWGGHTSYTDISGEAYLLDKPSEWKSLRGEAGLSFSGRMLGGCLDVICKLIGTRFAPVTEFIEKYRSEGVIWSLESCEMNAADIYRTLWQMRTCGWFERANGFLIGRPDGYSDSKDFTLRDALEQGLSGLGVPILYDADIGHVPPQMQIVNGAFGHVAYREEHAKVEQTLR